MGAQVSSRSLPAEKETSSPCWGHKVCLDPNEARRNTCHQTEGIAPGSPQVEREQVAFWGWAAQVSRGEGQSLWSDSLGWKFPGCLPDSGLATVGVLQCVLAKCSGPWMSGWWFMDENSALLRSESSGITKRFVPLCKPCTCRVLRLSVPHQREGRETAGFSYT